MVAQQVETVRRRIAAACERAGRAPDEITLIAVTKTVAPALIREALQAGIRDCGENFVQELAAKREELSQETVRWHFIGHLQSRKARSIAEWIHAVHSVDTVSLGGELSRRAAAAGRTLDVLLQVNSTGESTKFGVRPEECRALYEGLLPLPNLRVAGLMTIGPFLPDPGLSRPSFRLMRSLREELGKDGPPLPHLSMGMTNDFEVAIEEGATMVRIGTAIFGARNG